MAITIVKKKKVEAPVIQEDEGINLVEPSDLDLESLADLYGAYEDKINAMMANPIFVKFDEIKKELNERIANDYDPTDSLTIKGKHWLLEVGVAAKNPAKLKDSMGAAKMMGQEVFNKVAKVTLGDLSRYLTPEQYDTVVDTEVSYSSRRRISAKYLG